MKFLTAFCLVLISTVNVAKGELKFVGSEAVNSQGITEEQQRRLDAERKRYLKGK